MEVEILENNQAKDLNGNVYSFYALEIERKQTGEKIYYYPHERIFQLVATPGTKSNAVVVKGTNKLILL